MDKEVVFSRFLSGFIYSVDVKMRPCLLHEFILRKEKGDHSMLIRSFQLSDVNQVMELLQVALSEDCYEDTKCAFARQLSWDSELIMVAEVEDEIKGVLIGTIDQNTGCIYRMVVHPEYRRRGVGKGLVKALEQRFQQRNVRRIMIAGDEHNKAIMPLYEAMGYGASKFLEAFQKLGIAAARTLSGSN